MLPLTDFLVTQMTVEMLAEAALGQQLDDVIGHVYDPAEEFDHER